MKTVLFIAYQYPPQNSPGVFRSLYFSQYLEESGYRPIILTNRIADIEHSGRRMDMSLLEKVPKHLQIVRTPDGEPRTFKRWMNRLRIFRFFWYVAFPIFWENSALWPFKAWRQAEETIKANEITLIYTSSGPFSAFILGSILKFRTGVKWVADLRDPYTEAYAWAWPSKFHWYFSRWMERIFFRIPDRLIVNTPEVKEVYLKRRLRPASQISVLTNGY